MWVFKKKKKEKKENYLENKIACSQLKKKGLITTYPHVVWPKFKLPTRDLKFGILLTWG